MDLASTQNPVHWTSGPVSRATAPRAEAGATSGREHRFHRAARRGTGPPRGFADGTCQHASSIDSLVRVSRRAESGAVAPSSAARVCTGHRLGGRTARGGPHESEVTTGGLWAPGHGRAPVTGMSGDTPVVAARLLHTHYIALLTRHRQRQRLLCVRRTLGCVRAAPGRERSPSPFARGAGRGCRITASLRPSRQDAT